MLASRIVFNVVEHEPSVGHDATCIYLYVHVLRELHVYGPRAKFIAHACPIIILHACTMILVHACYMIKVHACITIIVHACTMIIVHTLIITHARNMITVHASTMIIVHACIMIIVHEYFVADRSGGLGAKLPKEAGGLAGRRPPNDGAHTYA